MTISISDGLTTVNPILREGYRTQQEAGVIVHSILGRSDPDVTIIEDYLRSGEMELLFGSYSAAETARALLASAATFTYTDSDLPASNLTFIRSGALLVAREGATNTYRLTVGFEEVPS